MSAADPLAAPAFVVARSLLLCERLSLDEPIEALGRKVQDHARMRFAANIANASQKDIGLWVRDLLRIEGSEARHPIDRLYDRMCSQLDLEVRWTQDGPTVPAKNVRTWLGLLNDFDENFILAFDLLRGRRPFEPPPAVPEKWKIITHIGDVQLDALLAGKATDLHVHLSGVRQASVAWACVMASDRGWRDFEHMAKQFESEMAAIWRDVAQQAFRDRRALCDALGRPQIALRQVWRDPDPAAILIDERALLACALARTRSDRVYPLLAPGPTKALEDSFWRYVDAKNKFQRAARQPAFAETPGLAHFDGRYFRATKPRDDARHVARPMRKWATLRSGIGFARAEHKAAGRVLAAEGCLAEVELRIAPFDRVADYLTFLHGWTEIMDELKREVAPSGHSLPDVRFAVHLVRTRRANEQRARRARRGRDEPVDPAYFWRAFHSDVARQTAVLQRTLVDPRHQDLTRYISRVDVAGQERDTPIELFAPHLRLLRGDEGALQMVEDLAAGRAKPDEDRADRWALQSIVHAAEWQRMSGSGRHRESCGGRLALTLHAGEDYADPLEGLFQIWAAVHTTAMQPGEAIGHGLALGDSLDDWCSPFARISPLQDWASLVWLRRTINRIDAALRWSTEGMLLDKLIDEAHAIFDRPAVESADWLFEHCYESAVPALPEWVWTAGAGWGGAGDRPATKRAGLRPLVRKAQKWLRRDLIEREIVIEANPSSNIRVSGASSLADLPTVALFEQVMHGLLFCINTDNPGTFATSIRTEYAVLLQGARERASQPSTPGEPPLTERDIRAVLKQVLEIGRTLIKRR